MFNLILMKQHFVFDLSRVLFCLINIIKIDIKIAKLLNFFKRRNLIKGKKKGHKYL